MGLQLKRAFDIVLKTKSYVLYRALIYAALCACAIAYLAMLSVIGAVFGAGAVWVLLIASGVMVFVLGVDGFIGEYVFYRLRAEHVALITEIISEGKFPLGISQTKWARGRVLHYFRGVSFLSEVRQLLRDIFRGVNRNLFDSAAVLPVPGIEGGLRCAERIVDFSQGYVQEAALGYAFKARNENVFESLRHSVMVYCQAWRVLLGNAVTLTLLSYAFALICSVVFLVPLGMIAIQIPDNWSVAFQPMFVRFTLFASGIFLGMSAKWALFDPVACASMVITFLEESEVVSANPDIETKVEAAAPKYGLLKERAIHSGVTDTPRADQVNAHADPDDAFDEQ